MPRWNCCRPRLFLRKRTRLRPKPPSFPIMKNPVAAVHRSAWRLLAGQTLANLQSSMRSPNPNASLLPPSPARLEEIERRNRKENHRGPKQMTTLAEFGTWVQEHLFFLDYAPVIFTSAQSGFHLDRLLEAVRYVAAQLQQKIPTSILNRALQDAVERRQPISSHGHRLKFFYATQVKEAPPTFLLFVNREDLFSDQYKKYLADSLRVAF